VKILTNLINLIHDSVFYVIRQHLGAYFYTTAFLYYSSLHALCHYTEKKKHVCRAGHRRSAFLVKETG